MDLAEVERLLGFMERQGLEEFEYERNGIRIRLKKPSTQPAAAFRAASSPEIVVAGSATASEAVPSKGPEPAPGPPGEAGRSDDLHVAKSPIVGTFYAAPSSGAEPFVSLGAHVEVGQVLCIIEAMKLMNEIEAEVAGEVVRIFVENGQPVEYGEPLFGILPHRRK